MDIEEGKEIQAKDRDNLTNKIAEKPPWSWERNGHPDSGDFQNAKQGRSVKKHPWHVVTETLNIQKKKNIESCKKNDKLQIKATTSE
jgi:hypothetical protein